VGSLASFNHFYTLTQRPLTVQASSRAFNCIKWSLSADGVCSVAMEIERYFLLCCLFNCVTILCFALEFQSKCFHFTLFVLNTVVIMSCCVGTLALECSMHILKVNSIIVYISIVCALILDLYSLTGGDPRPDSSSSEPRRDCDVFSPISLPPSSVSPSAPLQPTSTHGRSISISVIPCSDTQRASVVTEDAFTLEPSHPRATRASKTHSSKPSHTPPPASRKLMQLLPNLTMTRSKSHESQLANRIEEPATLRWV